MNPRVKKFLPYYKPYLGLFFKDMACAVVVSITLLAIPLCIRFITKNLEAHSPDALNQIYIMGGIMLVLVAIHAICHAFIDYKGHMMGALILETAVRDDKVMEDFESESFTDRGRHSLVVKAPPIRNDSGLKDCVNLSFPTAVSRIMDQKISSSLYLIL